LILGQVKAPVLHNKNGPRGSEAIPLDDTLAIEPDSSLP
jgi:hypothetical protein